MKGTATRVTVRLGHSTDPPRSKDLRVDEVPAPRIAQLWMSHAVSNPGRTVDDRVAMLATWRRHPAKARRLGWQPLVGSRALQ